METTNHGQVFYREEADKLFPRGCKCRDSTCDWCFVYYNGPDDVEEED